METPLFYFHKKIKFFRRMQIYTDGSCHTQQKIGGWAAVILFENKKIEKRLKNVPKKRQWPTENCYPDGSRSSQFAIFIVIFKFKREKWSKIKRSTNQTTVVVVAACLARPGNISSFWSQGNINYYILRFLFVSCFSSFRCSPISKRRFSRIDGAFKKL